MVTDLERRRSAHVKFSSREGVQNALKALGVGHGAALPVWPPRRLPHGLYISPVRHGWVSLWSPLDDLDTWFPQLTATLECAGLVLTVDESTYWSATFYQDGSMSGHYELPTEWVEMSYLELQAEELLLEQGIREPWNEPVLMDECMDALLAEPAFQRDLEELRAARPTAAQLGPYLPPHARTDRAWELLTSIDRRDDQPDEEGVDDSAEPYVETFASYLGILDATWSPQDDEDALGEGDYDEGEGLPEQWRDFVVLPVPHLRVL